MMTFSSSSLSLEDGNNGTTPPRNGSRTSRSMIVQRMTILVLLVITIAVLLGGLVVGGGGREDGTSSSVGSSSSSSLEEARSTSSTSSTTTTTTTASSTSTFSSSSSSITTTTTTTDTNDSSTNGLLWYKVCTQPTTQNLPFCNVTISISERVQDYSTRIPILSQIQMMTNTAASYKPLSIPQYQWWNEGLHGTKSLCISIAKVVYCPTSFPCPSGLGNTFDDELYYDIARSISRQTRTISEYHRIVSKNNIEHNSGLTVWAPTINLQRDPRWGRNQEVPGEDPTVTSVYTNSFVTGLQQEQHDTTTNTLQVVAGCKHFIANSLEHWNNITRHDVNAIVSIQELYNYYMIPFQTCIQHSHSLGIMCSYNRVNGIPSCVNDWLLKDIVRQKWWNRKKTTKKSSGIDNGGGYITTDCGALDDVKNGHHYVNTSKEVAALAMNASVDMNCGNGDYYPNALIEAYHEQMVQANTIQKSFQRLATIQFQLGLFDNNNQNQNNQNNDQEKTSQRPPIIPDVQHLVNTPEDQKLAHDAAMASIVVLQNHDSILPLLIPDDDTKKTIAVIGPHALCQRELLSNYHGQVCGNNTLHPEIDCFNHNNHDNDECYTCLETPFHAISNANNGSNNNNYKTKYKIGCFVDGTEFNEIDDAVTLAQESDIVILLMGLNQGQERENHDRTITTLPGLQMELIQRIMKSHNNNSQTTTTRPPPPPPPQIVLVLLHGGSISLGSEVINGIPAIVSASYGGQAGSVALADVLFGKYNPTGKLAATMYPPNYIETLPLTEMSLLKYPGRTYQYYQGNPEFEFGHGLSYSHWNLKWVEEQQVQVQQQGREENQSQDQKELHDDDDDDDDDDDENSSSLPTWVLELPASSSSFSFSSGWRLGDDDDDDDDEDSSTQGMRLPISVEVTNMGPYPGHQTVLLFWKPIKVTVPQHVQLPLQKLIHFGGTRQYHGGNITASSSTFAQRPVLQVHDVATLSWNITLRDFAHWSNAYHTVDPYDGPKSQMSAMVYPGVYGLEARAANRVVLHGRLVIQPSQSQLHDEKDLQDDHMDPNDDDVHQGKMTTTAKVSIT